MTYSSLSPTSPPDPNPSCINRNPRDRYWPKTSTSSPFVLPLPPPPHRPSALHTHTPARNRIPRFQCISHSSTLSPYTRPSSPLSHPPKIPSPSPKSREPAPSRFPPPADAWRGIFPRNSSASSTRDASPPAFPSRRRRIPTAVRSCDR